MRQMARRAPIRSSFESLRTNGLEPGRGTGETLGDNGLGLKERELGCGDSRR